MGVKPELIAEKYFRLAGGTVPVNLERLCRRLDFEVVEWNGPADFTAVLSVPQRVIVVNRNMLVVRRRFSIAHELGHYALGQAGNVVYVMTGPLYERDMPPLPECDEPHRVPSGYWKVIAIQPEDGYDSIRVQAFIFDQETPRAADPLDYQVTVDEVESRAHLDVMWELPDDTEARIESSDFSEWVEGSLRKGAANQ